MYVYDGSVKPQEICSTGERGESEGEQEGMRLEQNAKTSRRGREKTERWAKEGVSPPTFWMSLPPLPLLFPWLNLSGLKVTGVLDQSDSLSKL